jgi:hypothetical protein
MKGYIYTMFAGADPSRGWNMSDPIFGRVPTLGACMPNIRRFVGKGDHIFVVSGRAPGVRQYIVGGFAVERKIDALAAFREFPENRQRQLTDGQLAGNIIVDAEGKQSPIDYHSNFAKRLENYVVGRDPVVLSQPREIEQGRTETLQVLGELFNKKGDRVFDIIGRQRRLDGKQVQDLLSWLRSTQLAARG